jgi:hypothetical protein
VRLTEEQKARRRERYAENREAILAARRAERDADPEAVRARDRAAYAARREQELARRKQRRAENPGLNRKYSRNFYERNRDKMRRQNADWAAANPEKAAEYRAAWKRRNPEKVKAWRPAREKATRAQAEWRRKNPELAQAALSRYRERNRDLLADRARLRRATKVAPEAEFISREAVWERDRGICYLCEAACDPADWHLDHVVPLARGGSHVYNNVAVTHPGCNLSKGTRLLSEWRGAPQ